MATRAEPSFHLLGFMLAVGATCARAFKSILQVSSSAFQLPRGLTACLMAFGLQQVTSAVLRCLLDLLLLSN